MHVAIVLWKALGSARARWWGCRRQPMRNGCRNNRRVINVMLLLLAMWRGGSAKGSVLRSHLLQQRGATKAALPSGGYVRRQLCSSEHYIARAQRRRR